MRAVRAMVEGDATHIDDLFTPDVRTDSPASLASSRVELGAELDERRRSFRQHDIEFRHLDVHGDLARVEWVATGLHVGPFVLERDGTILQPTGLRLRVHAITQATFRGDRICAWRSTWDDVTLLEGEAARDAYA